MLTPPPPTHIHRAPLTLTNPDPVLPPHTHTTAQVIRMGADNMVSVMERAIESGSSVLIENMGETIDAVLTPVITRSTFKKGRNL